MTNSENKKNYPKVELKELQLWEEEVKSRKNSRDQLWHCREWRKQSFYKAKDEN